MRNSASVSGSLQGSCWHVITCEYPPKVGGVSDYTGLVAEALVDAGDEVHVWCPAVADRPANTTGPVLHQTMGAFGWKDLLRSGRLLNSCSKPRRLLVQWVPHGYGCKAVNLPFCLWLLARSVLHGDTIDVMAHECYLTFGKGFRRNAVAAVQRLMNAVLMQAASSVWVSTPEWVKRLQPLAFGRDLGFQWLPIPSTIPVSATSAAVHRVRANFSQRLLVGHFGTHNPLVFSMLNEWLANWSMPADSCALLLIGLGSERAREEMILRYPALAGSVFATGALPAQELSEHLAACDLLIQPFPDGVSGRRSSVTTGLAHRLPVVTTEGAATEPLWRRSGGVALVPADHPAAFSRTVHNLLNDSQARAALAAAGHQLYKDVFDIRRIVAKLRGTAATQTSAVTTMSSQPGLVPGE